MIGLSNKYAFFTDVFCESNDTTRFDECFALDNLQTTGQFYPACKVKERKLQNRNKKNNKLLVYKNFFKTTNCLRL